MKYFSFDKIYTVIDIGTTKICTIIARQVEDNGVEILGVGNTPSEGLSKGMVVDIPTATSSIQKSLQEAKIMASYDPESAFIGISGNHIQSYYSQGMSQIKNGMVNEEIKTEALSASQAIPLKEDQKLLHTIPIKYIIDGTIDVENPLGMHGMRLEIVSHLITANINSVQNLIHCCSLVGLKTQGIILEPIASGEAILNNEEKRMGVLLIDIGGGTSDVALYQEGRLNYTEIVLIAGNTFTNDLAVCLKTSHQEAERLKKECGLFSTNQTTNEFKIKKLDEKSEQKVSCELINEILTARALEFGMIINEIISQYKSVYNLPSGIVLTGGGSMLPGLQELIQQITKLPVRIGVPIINAPYKYSLDHPEFATAYGLLMCAMNKKNSNDLFEENNKDLSFKKIFLRMKNAFNNIFE